MIIEGNLLIGILVVVALVIVALGVYIRFAMKKDQEPAEETESLFGRLLKFGNKGEAEDEAQAGPSQGGPGGLSLSIPGLGGGKAGGEEKEKSSPGLGGLFSGMLGSRKNKDQIKEEVRAIDEQLNNVLQGTEEINVLGVAPQISAEDTPFSDGRGMRELDMEMGALQGPLEIVTPEELKIEPPALDLAPPPAPAVEPLKPEEEAAKAEKKPDAPPAPVEAVAAKPPAEFTLGDKKGGDDLLDDLEASSKQEEQIDMSIMKEYQDMPITCVEIESDLKSILDQITINAQGRKNQGM